MFRFIPHSVYVRIAGALFFMALFPDSPRSVTKGIQESSWPGFSGESFSFSVSFDKVREVGSRECIFALIMRVKYS